MAPPRQTILRPVGLVTQPNKFDWYVDGAMKRAINCVMRNPGELDAAPSMFASATLGSLTVDKTLKKVIPLDAGHAYGLSVSASGDWKITEGAGFNVLLPVTTFVSTQDLFSATGRISPVRSKDRMLMNSNNGYLVGDNMQPPAFSTLRLAGLPQLSINTSGSNLPASGGSIAAPASGSLVYGYQAIHTRTFADGYKIVSVPTPVLKQFISVLASPRIPFINLSWAQNDVAAVGDVIELYRSDGLPTTSFNTDPPSVYKLVAAVTLTASNIAVRAATINDNAKMGDAPYYQTGGRELYCNPGQGGATTINRQPPIAACTANFDGRTFYGNTTDRPRMTVQIPAGVGSSSNPQQQTAYWMTNGIGMRVVPGLTFTSGSAVITGGTAASLAGIVAGQRWYDASGTFFNYQTASVVSVNVGAGTITMSANSAGSGSGPGTFADCLYIGFNNGTKFPFRFADLGDLVLCLDGAGSLLPSVPTDQFEVTSNSSVYGGAVFQTLVAGAYNPNISLTLEPKNHGAGYVSMQVTATNGANYSPPLAEFNTTATNFMRSTLKNRLTWSKDQQPEHVPPSNNETFVGLREIIAMASTRDALWIACLDGLFRLTGVGGQYRLDQVDSTTIICAPQCMTTLNEDVYAYTNFGMLVFNSERRDNLTDERIGDVLPGPQYAEVATMQLVANETDLEIVYLDSSSTSRLYVYSTRKGGGWTTLENNGSQLQNITALAFQRSPLSGDARVLVGVSPLGGVETSYAGWGNTASFLTMDLLFQPVYAGDPMSLKQWIECSYIFDAGNTGKTLRPSWNGIPVGTTTVVQLQNAAYARAGVPRDHAIAQSISAGCDSVTGATPQARFLGLSLMFNALTTQAKQRT